MKHESMEIINNFILMKLCFRVCVYVSVSMCLLLTMRIIKECQTSSLLYHEKGVE